MNEFDQFGKLFPQKYLKNFLYFDTMNSGLNYEEIQNIIGKI